MLNKLACAALALMMVGFAGCASNDEVVARKDRLINERTQENLALKKRIEDQASTRRLLEKQYQEQKAALARTREEEQRARAEAEQLRLKIAKVQRESKPEPMEPVPTSPLVAIKDPDVEVETRANGDVVLRVRGDLTFGSGSAQLTRRGQATLSRVAKVLQRHRDLGISVEGHTDDTPLRKTRKKWGSNLNLSLARAIQVRDFLATVAKVDSKRMHVAGYGSTHPLVKGKTKAARARNRRVEIVLTRLSN